MTVLDIIQLRTFEWRQGGYQGAMPETLNIIKHIKRVGFLHQPQLEALETYIYLKEIENSQPLRQLAQTAVTDPAIERQYLEQLGLSPNELLDLAYNPDKKADTLRDALAEQFGEENYQNAVYALTMGAGKTLLMGTMLLYEFVLSYYHPDDPRFAKNALIFVPDKTVIASLREIKSFDAAKVLPKEYQQIVLNIKYHYLETTDTPLNPIGNFNVVVSNSQKIILKVQRKNTPTLFDEVSQKEKQAKENKRLGAIRQMEGLVVFVDEAHHAFGTDLEGEIKRVKSTINYINAEGQTPLVGVVNLTGTPYIKNQMIADVVYHFGLKDGIEQGILKQVHFYSYGNVKSDDFIDDVVEKFWTQYAENRLEGKLPKIAFYAADIDDLQQDLRPKLLAALAKRGIDPNKVLEYHTQAEANKVEFEALDTDTSTKQFILLVGKGTEGWNCRSLTACALFRKPTSTIFVLQSSTRCLRAIGSNDTVASVFLSEANAQILDRELQNNFATSMADLNHQTQEYVEHELKVEKRKTLKVYRKKREIVGIGWTRLDDVKIDWDGLNPDKFIAYMTESNISLDDGQQAEWQRSEVRSKVASNLNYSFYQIIERINRTTHLPCLFIEEALLRAKSKDELVTIVNSNAGWLPFLIESFAKVVYTYQEQESVIEEELELTKQYPFKISVRKDRNGLVVYKQDGDTNRLGFHINPYNFDSKDELSLFTQLRGVLEHDEAIADIYFSGGVTTPVHNDFSFAYYSPEQKRLAQYFPDMLIETTKGRLMVVEVKGNDEKLPYERNKEQYTGKQEQLFNEVYAKELGFNEFKELNRQYEYHIIFDASLQSQQQKLLAEVQKL